MTFSSGIASCSSASATTPRARSSNSAKLGSPVRSARSTSGIDEQANEIFSLDLIAPGDLRAHRDVCGAGIAMQQRDQSGVRQHEQRAAILASDRAEPVRQVPVQQLRLDRPGRSLR